MTYVEIEIRRNRQTMPAYRLLLASRHITLAGRCRSGGRVTMTKRRGKLSPFMNGPFVPQSCPETFLNNLENPHRPSEKLNK